MLIRHSIELKKNIIQFISIDEDCQICAVLMQKIKKKYVKKKTNIYGMIERNEPINTASSISLELTIDRKII